QPLVDEGLQGLLGGAAPHLLDHPDLAQQDRAILDHRQDALDDLARVCRSHERREEDERGCEDAGPVVHQRSPPPTWGGIGRGVDEQTTCALERIADREMETPGLLARAPVQLVAPIDPDGTEGGPVAQAQSGRVTQVTELEVAYEGVDVAGVEKGAEGETAAQVDPHLGSAENESVPPRGEEVAVGPRLLGARGVHREAPGA